MIEGFHVGDAANLSSVGIEENSVQTIVTSPPYWKARDYGLGNDQLGFEDEIADYIANLGEIISGFRPFLHRTGTVWIVIGDCYNTRTKIRPTAHSPGLKHGDELTGDTNILSWREMSAAGRVKHSARTGWPFKEKDLVPVAALLADELLCRGWYYRADIIWNKPFGKPENVKDRPSLAHEHVLLLSLREHGDPIPEAERGVLPNGRKGPKTTPSYKFKKTLATWRSVWEISPGSGIPGLIGPAVFPSKLVEQCLEATTDPGDLVLDPFAGSGVTLHTARRMKRRAVGVDRTDEWWDSSLSEAPPESPAAPA